MNPSHEREQALFILAAAKPVAECLVQLYDATGKMEKAAEWKKTLAALNARPP